MNWFTYWMAVSDFWYGPIVAPPVKPTAKIVRFADFKRAGGGR